MLCYAKHRSALLSLLCLAALRWDVLRLASPALLRLSSATLRFALPRCAMPASLCSAERGSTVLGSTSLHHAGLSLLCRAGLGYAALCQAMLRYTSLGFACSALLRLAMPGSTRPCFASLGFTVLC